VVDSLNYGDLVDPSASGGFRGAAGKAATCHAGAPGMPSVDTVQRGIPGIPFSGAVAQFDATQGSTGRYPDGQDTDNDCADFTTSASSRTGAAAAGAMRIAVDTVAPFAADQTVVVDAGGDAETLTVATVGSPGLTRAPGPVDRGATDVRVDDARQFAVGQTVVIGRGADEEQGVVAAVETGWRTGKLTLQAPLARAHDAGTSVSGTGVTFTGALAKVHPAGASMTATDDRATPGATNRYVRRGVAQR